MKRLLPVLKSLLIPAACIGIAVVAFIDIAPPGRITSMDLDKLKWEAEAYRRKQGRCAATLAELVRAPEVRNLATRDRWGHVFSYECKTDGSMLIESLGADGVRGGTGEDQDLTLSVPAVSSGK